MNDNKALKWILDGSGKRRAVLISFDVLCFVLMDIFYYFIALRASSSVPVEETHVFLVNSAIQFALVFAFRAAFNIYKNVWRYSNTKVYFTLVVSDGLAGVISLIIIRLLNFAFPGVYYGLWQAATVGALTALVTLMSRFAYIILHKKSSVKNSDKKRVPVALVGAGRLGSYLAGDLKNNPNSGFLPVFFVDTDPSKIGNRVSGLRVYDPKNAQNQIELLGIRDVIISIAQKTEDDIAELYYHYRDMGCKVKVYDSLVSSQSGQAVLREFTIEDLLFRKPIDVAEKHTNTYYNGKTVLVTGGGGSIGSELCRQIAACEPKKLVIFDIYENNAYDIQQELVRTYGKELDLTVEIGSVRDTERLEKLFSDHKPNVVFHAAAHKHVPLMENSPGEAIKNNVLGTYNTANAAEKHGVEKFILISTDKAVNPTNVMGASKRLCEMVVQCRTDSKTCFAAVRFGNVLGSNGSVIPLFKKQIAEGGPVTITDKRIIRYFMTIPEASQLVIGAGAMAKRGELFVLDMGKPVRIYDLAVNMIKLSGLEPGVDIEIKEIGLRPGEKLYEELLMQNETLDKTENDLIFIERDTPYTREQVEEKLSILKDSLDGRLTVKEAVAITVPTYRDPETVNKNAAESHEMKLAGV